MRVPANSRPHAAPSLPVMNATTDVAVIGAGVVGSSIAYGLAARGARVIVLDAGKGAFSASRANFGLVWLHIKGDGKPAYAEWTRLALDRWPAYATRLLEETGCDPHYRKSGGLAYCLGETEVERRVAKLAALRTQGSRYVHETVFLERGELERLIPGVPLSAEVRGASYCPHDGTIDPLRLLRALHGAMQLHGAQYRPASPAVSIRSAGGAFEVVLPDATISAGKVVLAAGLGLTPLMSGLGFDFPLRVERGQILVTERTAPLLPLPANGLRQSDEGSVLIGSTAEDVGFNISTTPQGAAKMAARATRIVPALAQLKLVRTWAGLRIYTPDGCPAYAESAHYPGAFIATCHSGVSLAPLHTDQVAEFVLSRKSDSLLNAFHPGRFHVPAAA
jgi:glycine/D-amino acid oxidase-like deaminating enzyme